MTQSLPATPLRIFITGASDGIGAALARHYANGSSATVELGLVARRGEQLAELAAGMPKSARCFIYPLDVTDPDALRAAANDFIERAGLPDIVIANAGISMGTLTEEADDLRVFSRIMQVNVLGMINTFHPFVAAMRTARRGQLVGIASVTGIRGLPGAGAYCASKAAAISYLESLRVELHGSGVTVSTILPGYVESRITATNPYRMPFILPVDEGARRIAWHIGRRTSYAVMPWQMAIVVKLLRVLPNWLFDRLFAHAGRKPRQLPL